MFSRYSKREEHKEKENSDPQTRTRTQQTERTAGRDFISMVVGATNDRLPIDAHWGGRWNT